MTAETTAETNAGFGRLTGVGVGPGDPDLLTIRAARLITAADVIAYHCARHGRSIARSAAEPYLRDGQVEEVLQYPVTTEGTDHPGGYNGVLADFYVEAAARLERYLLDGRDVVVLCEGDPSFYGSYLHLHKRLSGRFDASIVPGISSVSAAAAATSVPLVQHDETLLVLPGTLPPDELRARLTGADAAAVLKLGRTFGKVRAALDEAGLLDRARYVERAGTGRERVAPLADVDPADVPYMSLALVPGHGRRRPAAALDVGSAAGVTADGAVNAEPGVTEMETSTADGTAPADAGPSAGTASTTGFVTGAAVGAGPAASTATPSSAADDIARNTSDNAVRGVAGVTVVGLGPGDPAWLTPEAAEALADATDLVGYRPYLARIPVREGQQRHASGNTVEADRAAFALDLAAAGRRVAVVSSGDPGVFAMATAVLEQAADAHWDGVPVTVLPGVTAAQAVAARAGAPLGHDYCVISLSDRLKPWEVIADRVGHAAEADLVLALYNPASRSRTWQLAAVSELLLRHRDPATPVVVGRAVGRADERLSVITLAELATADIDMSTLVIVGSSATRVFYRNRRPVVFTPRHYGEAGEAASSRPRRRTRTEARPAAAAD
jgi:precorrin-2 C20-methyltransferase/precorrin-3B C17-methyltransferase